MEEARDESRLELGEFFFFLKKKKFFLFCFFLLMAPLSLRFPSDLDKAHSRECFFFSPFLSKKPPKQKQKQKALHPYSNPIAPSQPPPSKASQTDPSSLTSLLPPILHFSDLQRLSELQAERAAEAPSKIGGVRVGADKGARAPQAVVAATEQGWASSGAKAPSAAAAICEAHSTVVAAAPTASNKENGIVGVAFVTHNDFQAVSKTDATGLVPAAAGAALRSLEPGASPTLSAYESTRVGVWNNKSGHYCCAVVGLGCGGGGNGGSAR